MTDHKDCPHCGCADVERLKTSNRFGRPVIHCRCRHCLRRYRLSITDPAPRGVDVQTRPEIPTYPETRKPRCPEPGCDGRGGVTSTRPKIRYHKCESCGHSFKTVRNLGK